MRVKLCPVSVAVCVFWRGMYANMSTLRKLFYPLLSWPPICGSGMCHWAAAPGLADWLIIDALLTHKLVVSRHLATPQCFELTNNWSILTVATFLSVTSHSKVTYPITRIVLQYLNTSKKVSVIQQRVGSGWPHITANNSVYFGEFTVFRNVVLH